MQGNRIDKESQEFTEDQGRILINVEEKPNPAEIKYVTLKTRARQ